MTGGESDEGRKRRWRTVEERRAIVAETLRPGVSVAQVARSHGINANLLFKWRRQHGASGHEADRATRAGGPSGVEAATFERHGAATELLPVVLRPGADGPVGGVELSMSGAIPAESIAPVSAGVIHIHLGQARLRIEGQPDPATIRAVLGALRG